MTVKVLKQATSSGPSWASPRLRTASWICSKAWVDPDLALALQEAVLPTDDLAEPGRSFFAYATVSGERVGYGGFERLGRDVDTTMGRLMRIGYASI